MKPFIVCLLFGLSLTVIGPLSFSQQNQNVQKPNPEIDALKIQLQTVENEKIELRTKLLEAQAKLADANTKLIDTEFSDFESKLRDSNDKWLWTWIQRFAAVISVFMLIMGAALWLLIRSLIADRVEKSLNGFKEALAQVDTLKNQLEGATGQVNILKDQIRILEKEHAASVLGDFMHYNPEHYPEQVKELPEHALLDVFSDETRHLELRGKAAEVLTY